MLCAVAVPAAAQSRIPQLHATRELLIDAASNDLSTVTFLTAFRDGTIAVGQAQDHLIRFFDVGGKSLGTFGRNGEGPGEFRVIERAGWLGDTLWVSDGSQSRLTLIGAGRKLAGTVSEARGMRAGVRDTTTDVVQAVVTVGLYPGGDQLVVGVIPALDDTRLPTWARVKANTGSRIAVGRVTARGVLLRSIAFTPFDPCGLDMSALGRLCQRPIAEISGSGDRVVMATATTAGSGQGTFRVVALGMKGDTLFSRQYGFQPVPIDRHLLDSLTALAAAGPKPPKMRGMATERPAPTIYPPIIKIVLGRDGSTWIEMRATAAGRTYLVLDPKGTVIGNATFPANVTVLAATRTTAWGTLKDADDVESVVRYSVKP